MIDVGGATSGRGLARGRARSRAGLTLLEVLLAVTLLSLTVALVTTAMNNIMTMEQSQRARLAGFELAHRLLLQWMDDKDSLPPKQLPLTYGPRKFFYEVYEDPMRMVVNDRQRSSGGTLQGLDRYIMLTVVVFDTEGTYEQPVKGEAIARLSRIVDPVLPRNPDSMDKIGKDPTKLKRLIDSITGGAGGGGAQKNPFDPLTRPK